MSGHSKWASIKHKKGVTDARRGQLFTKLAREIQVAAREGGSDPESNFRLRLAVQRAKQESMPAENISRAIARGSGIGRRARYRIGDRAREARPRARPGGRPHSDARGEFRRQLAGVLQRWNVRTLRNSQLITSNF